MAVEVGQGTYLIDLKDKGVDGWTGSYLVVGERLAVVETGATAVVPRLLEGIRRLGYDPRSISYILVTHIHLDHGGGAGYLAREIPEAEVIVHPRGARHLVDPSRLAAGAERAWGPTVWEMYGEIVPVPAGRVRAVPDGEEIDLGDGRRLKVIDTPGHASHHLCFYDPLTRGLFCGDALGSNNPGFARDLAADLRLPVTPPPDFDPVQALDSIRKLALLAPDVLYFTHFGPERQAAARLERAAGQMLMWTSVAETAWAEGGQDMVASRLREYAARTTGLRPEAVRDSTMREVLEDFLRLNTEGFILYLSRREKERGLKAATGSGRTSPRR